jgi:phosphatidylserine/phosphatidylglycerophosphate/cardiolipin synthase-like enzyme
MIVSPMRVHFGGPDRPDGALAAVLSSAIERVPAGGEIHWVAYYFGNLELAKSLLSASRRGVRVFLDIDAHPRRAEVNAEVLRLLGGPKGVLSGLRPLAHVLPGHVHEKIYFFSHPRPAAYVGSYNPSRNLSDSEDLLDDIGDQDRGHNYLVEITDSAAVSFLHSHLQAMHASPHGVFERYGARLNATFDSPDLNIYFFPRKRSNVHIQFLQRTRFERIRIAASHFRDSSIARLLATLSVNGTSVEVLAHDTFRRVPVGIERILRTSGVNFRRYRHPEKLPMHCKFMLLEGKAERRVLFGSLNLTRTSRWLNHEVLLCSSNQDLFAALDARWTYVFAEAAKYDGLP